MSGLMRERRSVDQVFEKRPKVLFLDDDLARGEIFLIEYPGAVWVQTAEECIDRLSEPWDEVHLDHDLGGEVFVDHEREDCGMAVVRWLCAEPRRGLAQTQFIVHTHNLNAGCLMALHLEAMGYHVQIRPFGEAGTRSSPPGYFRSLATRVLRWLSGGGDRRVTATEIAGRPGRLNRPDPSRSEPGGSLSGPSG
jgi:hypothetical protein